MYYSTGHLPKRLLLQPHFTLFKPSKRFLYFLSLSIRILLFMLLVVSCDVERNPGPETYLGTYIPGSYAGVVHPPTGQKGQNGPLRIN